MFDMSDENAAIAQCEPTEPTEGPTDLPRTRTLAPAEITRPYGFARFWITTERIVVNAC